jgi:hypothetical protein
MHCQHTNALLCWGGDLFTCHGQEAAVGQALLSKTEWHFRNVEGRLWVYCAMCAEEWRE